MLSCTKRDQKEDDSQENTSANIKEERQIKRRAEQEMKTAIKLYEAGQYDKAQIRFKYIADNYRSLAVAGTARTWKADCEARILYKEGMWYLKNNMHGEALKCFDKIIVRYNSTTVISYARQRKQDCVLAINNQKNVASSVASNDIEIKSDDYKINYRAEKFDVEDLISKAIDYNGKVVKLKFDVRDIVKQEGKSTYSTVLSQYAKKGRNVSSARIFVIFKEEGYKKVMDFPIHETYRTGSLRRKRQESVYGIVKLDRSNSATLFLLGTKIHRSSDLRYRWVTW
jgi:tetratricopeptide (TPR) repeat protein